MKEVLDRNYQKGREQWLREMKAKRRQDKIESFLVVFIGLFIVGATLYILSVQGTKAVKDCMSLGYSEIHCKGKLL
jgi:hypothetical protein